MKKPYRLRWEPKFFIRAIIFGILFLAFQLVLNYLKRDKIMEKNEILRSYGTGFKGMTKRLLETAGLSDMIPSKAARIVCVACAVKEVKQRKKTLVSFNKFS